MKRFTTLLSVLICSSLVFGTVTPNKTDFVDYCTGANNSNCVFQVDTSGNVTGKNVTAQGTLAVTGATTLTGATTATGGATVGSYLTFSSSAPVITAAGQQIVPTGSYVLLNPSNLAPNTAMTAAPTISTMTPSGANIPDGTFLIVASTSPLAVKLQDVGSLAGSGLFLGSAIGGPTGGVPQTYVLVSSTMTQTFVLNASTGAWILTSR